MIAAFGTMCDCFIFTPWTGLQLKQVTSVIDNCITKQALNAALLIMQSNNVTDKHNRKGRNKKKSGTAESMLGQKSGLAHARSAGPPTTALFPTGISAQKTCCGYS